MVIYDNSIAYYTNQTGCSTFIPTLFPCWQSGTGTFVGSFSQTSNTTSSTIYVPVLLVNDNSTTITTISNNCGTYSSHNVIIWPEWHDDIDPQMPALIRERMELERAREEQQFLANQELRRLMNEKAEEAKQRARAILLDHLTSEQRDMVEKNGWFVIEGGKSKKLYRIKSSGVAGNVEEIDRKTEKVIAKYCCHLEHSYPHYDHHLTQKLMLEWDEDEFLRKANRTLVG